MIPQLDTFFVVVPSERAYLAATEDEWVQPHFWSPPRPKELKRIGTFSRSRARELVEAAEWPYGPREITIERAPCCACCGRTRFTATLKRVGEYDAPKQWRCEQHVGRNPCVVEGCSRTCAGRHPNLSSYICGRHWKLVPRSMKLVYSRIWRLQKKSGGWTDTLIARYWRIWPRIVSVAVNKARGGEYLDLAALEREFGL